MSYTNINIGSRGRMAVLKRNADKLNAGHNLRKAQGNLDPYTWRDVRYCGFHNARVARCELSQGSNGDVPVWYCHTGQYFPREIFVDEYIGSHGSALINHKGWFTSDDCYETIRGLVVRLPHGRFLAGYHSSDNSERVYFADVYDCERDAVYAADSAAKRVADDELEYNEKYNAAHDLQDKIDKQESRLKECLALRNNDCFSGLRKEARDLINAIRKGREKMNTEYAGVL